MKRYIPDRIAWSGLAEEALMAMQWAFVAALKVAAVSPNDEATCRQMAAAILDAYGAGVRDEHLLVSAAVSTIVPKGAPAPKSLSRADLLLMAAAVKRVIAGRSLDEAGHQAVSVAVVEAFQSGIWSEDLLVQAGGKAADAHPAK